MQYAQPFSCDARGRTGSTSNLPSNLPAANLHRVPNAWHFAFMDTPSMSLPSPDGDVAANPPGFDRDAFLKQLGTEIVAFFDKTLR
jgi:predicted dienelactone hydrolase